MPIKLKNPVSKLQQWKSSGLFLVWLIVLYPVLNLKAEIIRVAVASNFLKTAQSLSREFEAQSEHSIQLSSGSSGKLYLQISKGAPFDLFLSADTQKPEELVKGGFAIADSKQTYAIGKLSLWLKICQNTTDFSFLTNDLIRKIAIANPKLAPYGMASKQLLEKYQLWNNLNHKMLFPENIAQVAQLAKIGIIDAAFVATSQSGALIGEEQSCLLDIPPIYPIIAQQLVLITNSKKHPLAKEFVQFILSRQGQNLIKNMGYSVPNSAKIGL